MTAATTPPADDTLDRIDRRILRELQADGRISNADLAKRISLSAAACHRRVARLVEDGYITRFTALIDPARVDLGVLVHV
ncbi:Lrp/AsnC family transcriptional regulator, partial [Enterococcus faecium]